MPSSHLQDCRIHPKRKEILREDKASNRGKFNENLFLVDAEEEYVDHGCS